MNELTKKIIKYDKLLMRDNITDLTALNIQINRHNQLNNILGTGSYHISSAEATWVTANAVLGNLDAKLPLAGGEMAGDIDVNGYDLKDVKELNFVDGGSTVDIIRDEDDMATNDANALATQQSIKAYADLKLPLAGGTLTGDLTLSNSADIKDVKELNFVDGGATVDIVRDEDNMASDDANALATQQSIKAYADLKLPLAGGTMSGDIAMGTNKVTGLGAATANGDALRYEHLPVLCAVTRSTAWTHTTQNTYEALEWTVDTEDNAAMHDTSSNKTRISIVETGWYHITASVYWSADPVLSVMYLRKDGTTVINQYGKLNGEYDIRSWVVYLTASSYIELMIYQNNANNFTTSAGIYPTMIVYKIATAGRTV